MNRLGFDSGDAKDPRKTPQSPIVLSYCFATAEALIDRMRALTTNRTEEAAWFVRDGRRYRIQAKITEDVADES